MVVLGLSVTTLSAQQRGVEPAAVVVERGPHHRVWQKEKVTTLPNGRAITNRSSVVELETGMHYLKDGHWVESKGEIEIFNGAAVARQGPMQVIFAANLNSPGAIDLLADGQRFRSHVLGLVYTDYASGKSVMVAEIKDSIGELTAPNQVTYSDAFAGDCVADVRFTYTKGAIFEQDIILRTAPPSPSEWGLNPETTRLEVFTEFLEAPPASATSVILKQEQDPQARLSMKEPDLIDQRLDFGGLHIGQGQAFPLGATPDLFDESAVPTGKSLENIDGRLVLIEKVNYTAVREHLGRLPKSASLNRQRRIGLPDPGQTMQARVLPSRPAGEPGKWTRKLQASITPPRAGYVLDYVAHWTSSLTNYTFQGDTTYFITNSATVNFYGTTVIEGGAVIKTGVGSYIYFNGAIDCRTDAYRPAFVTAKDDDTVGEKITGSTGVPSGYYSTQPFGLKDTSAVYNLHDVRVRYCSYAFNLYASVQADFSNIQIGNSGRGVAWLGSTATTWRNFLFHDLANYAFQRNGSATNRAEHGTLHRVNSLISSTNSSTLLFLTNSLVIAVTNTSANFQGAYNVVSAGDSGFFQTVGAATHYLASGSTNRNAGTTNIHSALLAAIKKKTTYPPTVIGDGSYYTNSLTLYPNAQRDTDIPDLGYHYEPLDYVFSAIYLTNATITATPGVAIGIRTLNGLGLGLLGGSAFSCEGTPDNLNRIVLYNMVQEQSNTNWTDFAGSTSYSILTAWTPTATPPALRLRFTEFSVPAATADYRYHIYGGEEDGSTHDIRDCQFHSGTFLSYRPTLHVTNGLFNRVRLAVAELYDMNPTFRNCTFVGGDMQLIQASSTTWTFKDNLFDATTLYMEGTITHDYNGYTTNITRLTPTASNDRLLIVTNITYNSGWLGRFYLPTNLVSQTNLLDRGSTTADVLGLYHHTAVTNQTRELTSTVDVGFHYVAVGTNGVPLDTDGDGLADYAEDIDGDGTADAGETNWQSYNSLNGLGTAPALQVFTPLK